MCHYLGASSSKKVQLQWCLLVSHPPCVAGVKALVKKDTGEGGDFRRALHFELSITFKNTSTRKAELAKLVSK